MRRKKITLNDVARTAGVSMTAVSNVLSNNLHSRISPRTRERIIQAVYETGYSSYRRRAATAEKQPLSVFVFSRYSLGDTHTMLRLRSIEQALLPYGGRMLMNVSDTASRQIAAGDLTSLFGVGGVIFLSRADRSCADVLKAKGIPAVILGSEEYYDDMDMTYCNPIGYPATALRYLQSLGHERIGVLLHPFAHYSLEVSRLMFADYLSRKNLPVEQYLKPVHDASDIPAAIKELLDAPVRPTVIVGICAHYATGIVRQQGLRIPEDVSILAYDIPGTEGQYPISYIGGDTLETGKAAVELLLWRMKNPQGAVRHIVFPVQVHDYGSCARVE